MMKKGIKGYAAKAKTTANKSVKVVSKGMKKGCKK